MPKVGIIVLAWNGERFLPKCLETIQKTDYPKEELFFILVDNGSDDESLEIFKEFQKKHSELCIEIIHNTKNLGFASGNNVGFERALELGLDYAVTLNQDIQEVDPLWLLHLVGTLEENPRLASVQARLMRYPNKDIVNSVGNNFHFLGFGYSKGNGDIYTAPEDPIQEIAYASGGALCVRMELIEKYGGFQEETFMYHDDLELGLRYRLLGYRIACNHNAVVYHKYEFSRSIKKYYWMERNRIWILLEYYKWRTLLLIVPIFLCMEIGLVLFSIRSGFFTSKIKSLAYFSVPWHWIKIIKRRRYIQSIRRISDRELLSLASARIEDQEIKNPLLEYIGNPIMRVYFAAINQLI